MLYDLIVIGAGPGGYVCAIRAAQLGLKVAIVEKENLGGVCLNWGCIPTKALLRSAEVYSLVKNSEAFGISSSGVMPDLMKIVDRSRSVAKQLSSGIASLMKKNKIEVINGVAEFLSSSKIKVQEQEYSAKNFVIATGARARVIPGYESGQRIWTYREAMTPKIKPSTIAVVGSGAIGSEFAYFYNSIGVKTILLEVLDRILPTEDLEVSDFVKKSFEKQGMNVKTGIKLKSATENAQHVDICYEADGKEEKICVDALIMAVGVIPNTDTMVLEKSGVKLDEKNLVSVDKYMRTSVKNIFAIGDITQGPWLAHKASHEGVIAAEIIASDLSKYEKSKIHTITRENIPGCIYSHPQIASIGMTEAKAKEIGRNIRIGKFPLIANGKAIALGDSSGFVKSIFDAKTGEILGVHMVGPEVTEMIHGIAIAKQAELTEEDLMHTIFPHPTISEAIHESVLSAFGSALHF